VFIREDGKGFLVRKGGVDFDVWEWQKIDDSFFWIAQPVDYDAKYRGEGLTIHEAVDNALAKLKERA
jgi:hypothetical protein